MSELYRSILAPIEFDEPSLLALNFAKQIAIAYGARIHLLHVASILPSFRAPDVTEDEHSPGEEKARATLNEVAAQHLSCVDHQIHTASAGPRALAKAIVRVASEVDADVIVLRTHGRKGLSRFILGSVAEEVVQNAPCAVLTFSAEAEKKVRDLIPSQKAQ